jgi:hypothetical protein
MMSTSQCALCGQPAVLIDSHLLPKALYRLMRDPGLSNPNPVLLTKGKDTQTSTQIKRYLLCAICEDLFNKNGESWTLKHCFRGRGKFFLRDLLRTATPLKSDLRGDLIATAGLSTLNRDKLVYFAASVFWRASISDWPIRRNLIPQISLGPLQGEFRNYLLGNAAFPTSCSLLLYVAGDPTPPLAMHPPQCGNSDGLLECRFVIPGIRFSLLPQRGCLPISLTSEPHHPVFISNEQSGLLARQAIELREI